MLLKVTEIFSSECHQMFPQTAAQHLTSALRAADVFTGGVRRSIAPCLFAWDRFIISEGFSTTTASIRPVQTNTVS